MHLNSSSIAGDPRTLRALRRQREGRDDRRGAAVAIDALEDTCEKVQPPLTGWRKRCTLGDVSDHAGFALANAGVLQRRDRPAPSEPVTLGVALGLLLGKPIGIGLASWIAVKARMAMLPSGVPGTTFTAPRGSGGSGSRCRSSLRPWRFPIRNCSRSEIGILGGSFFAGIVGFAILLRRGRDDASFRGEWLNRSHVASSRESCFRPARVSGIRTLPRAQAPNRATRLRSRP